MNLPITGAVQDLVQRRMSHLQAFAWVAREALPPPKLPLLLLYHCLSPLRLCGDPQFCVQRGSATHVERAEQGSTCYGDLKVMPFRCAFSRLLEDWPRGCG